METQANGCTLRSFNHPIRPLKCAKDVGSFDFFQGIGSWRQRYRVRMEKRVIDLKHRSFREDPRSLAYRK